VSGDGAVPNTKLAWVCGSELDRDALRDNISRVVWYDETQPTSEGADLALKHDVNRAPFFIVEGLGDEVAEKVYTVYFKMKKEVFGKRASAVEQNHEVVRDLAAVL